MHEQHARTPRLWLQIDFPSNAGAEEALALLEPAYAHFKGQASFADIIVLAGNIAVEKAGGPVLPFCPGRVDADSGTTVQDLSPRMYYRDPLTAAVDTAQVCTPSQALCYAYRLRHVSGSAAGSSSGNVTASSGTPCDWRCSVASDSRCQVVRSCLAWIGTLIQAISACASVGNRVDGDAPCYVLMCVITHTHAQWSQATYCSVHCWVVTAPTLVCYCLVCSNPGMSRQGNVPHTHA